MIAVIWRQHRLQISSGAAVIGALSLFLWWSGHQMTDYLTSTGLSSCLQASAGCDALSTLFEDKYGTLLGLIVYLNFMPMLIGVFWGAPLVAREMETGTHRLAWTQSVTRRRWLGTRLAVFCGATAVLAGAFSALLGWWLQPFARLSFGDGFARMDVNSFDFQGVVPVAYSLFAFALGTTAGILLRRVLPAMAVTFAVFLPTRLWIQSLRGHFLSPVQITYRALTTSPRAGLGDWVVSSRIIDAHGHGVTDQAVFSACGVGPGSSKSDVSACVVSHGFRQIDSFQPAARFWPIQGIESSIFVILALALLAVGVYWVSARSRS